MIDMIPVMDLDLQWFRMELNHLQNRQGIKIVATGTPFQNK